jgi:hypothetical protein
MPSPEAGPFTFAGGGGGLEDRVIHRVVSGTAVSVSPTSPAVGSGTRGGLLSRCRASRALTPGQVSCNGGGTPGTSRPRPPGRVPASSAATSTGPGAASAPPGSWRPAASHARVYRSATAGGTPEPPATPEVRGPPTGVRAASTCAPTEGPRAATVTPATLWSTSARISRTVPSSSAATSSRTAPATTAAARPKPASPRSRETRPDSTALLPPGSTTIEPTGERQEDAGSPHTARRRDQGTSSGNMSGEHPARGRVAAPAARDPPEPIVTCSRRMPATGR